jgi:hypothetical protein
MNRFFCFISRSLEPCHRLAVNDLVGPFCDIASAWPEYFRLRRALPVRLAQVLRGAGKQPFAFARGHARDIK